MSCPDLSALARAGTPRADPAVVEHIRSCDSCWLDWQIQQGARFLLDPQVKVAKDLDDRIVARAVLLARHSERPANWRRLVVTGLLVGAAAFLLLVIPNDAAGPMSVSHAAFWALGAGAVAGFYYWRRDRREFREVEGDSERD